MPESGSGKLAMVAAGGTGGHMFPAEALARELIARGWRIALATDARGAAHARSFPAEERLSLEAATFKASDPVGMVQGALKIAAGVRQAKAAIRRLKPAVVVGFGGYPSLPAMIAARQTRTRSVIHEQNAVMGRANRLLAGRATVVACAFPTLQKAPAKVAARAVVVGNPVRPEIRALYDQPYTLPDQTLRILVTGGSQGARVLSLTTPHAIAKLSEDLRLRLKVEQQTRAELVEEVKLTYAETGVEADIEPFFRDMAERLARAHLVIGRSGASSVCEFAVAGRPAILVPLGIAIDDDQGQNAKLLAEVDAAVVIAEKNLTTDSLAEALTWMLADPERLAAMAANARSVARPDAAERLADLVEQTGG